jgi:2-polyprenyl-3-methyl-5-hydroxy-6-metoxy-1,4-benzoquinol methylase
MSYADLTINSSSGLKRFSHRSRFASAISLLALQPGEKVLDFGCGDGYLISQLLDSPAGDIVGYEPYESQERELECDLKNRRVRLISDLADVQGELFDKICCLEVLEHLPEASLLEAVCWLRAVLMPSGIVIISVPIEIFGAAPIKYIVRRRLKHLEPGMSIASALKAMFGRPVNRPSEPAYCGHLGFDYRTLEHLFREVGFRILETRFSPIPVLGPALNSQVLYRLIKTP